MEIIKYTYIYYVLTYTYEFINVYLQLLYINIAKFIHFIVYYFIVYYL